MPLDTGSLPKGRDGRPGTLSIKCLSVVGETGLGPVVREQRSGVKGEIAEQNEFEKFLRQPAASSGTEQQETRQATASGWLMPRDATGCMIVQPVKVELDGLEPTTPALQTRCSPN